MSIFDNSDRKYDIMTSLTNLSEDLLEATSNSEYKDNFRIECAEKITEVTKLIMFLENH